jgi:multidrug efflux pump subunit AcrA (membrane-fusion protein)
MADEQAQTQAGPAAGDGQTSGTVNTGADGTGATAGTGVLTQEQVNALVGKARTDAAAKAQREAEKRTAELQAELETLRAAAEARKLAEMTELEKAQAEAAEAKRQAQEATQAAASARTDALRANLIATQAATLPPAYKAQVTGDDQDAITASIAEVQAHYEAAQTEFVASLARMAPEQIAEQFGEAGKALAERLSGRQVPSIGSPGNTSAPPSQQAPVDTSDGRLSSWLSRAAKPKP